jgi:hypothetical protein
VTCSRATVAGLHAAAAAAPHPRLPALPPGTGCAGVSPPHAQAQVLVPQSAWIGRRLRLGWTSAAADRVCLMRRRQGRQRAAAHPRGGDGVRRAQLSRGLQRPVPTAAARQLPGAPSPPPPAPHSLWAECVRCPRCMVQPKPHSVVSRRGWCLSCVCTCKCAYGAAGAGPRAPDQSPSCPTGSRGRVLCARLNVPGQGCKVVVATAH